MAKDTYYFSHDYNARNDEKILELRVEYGAEGYGLFWMIVETMAENENGGIKASLIGGLSLAYGVAKDSLSKFIIYCVSIELFYEEGGFYFSKRLKKHKELRNKLSEDGKKGAKSRWGNSPPISPPNAKERKGKEIKGKENTIPDFEPPIDELILIPSMFKIFKAKIKTYPGSKDKDFKPLLSIANFIHLQSGLNGDIIKNQKIISDEWEKLVSTISKDNFYRDKSLSVISNQIQNIYQINKDGKQLKSGTSNIGKSIEFDKP